LIADAVDPSQRGRAFGFHRAADHAGAVAGPLLAFALLRWFHLPLRTVFLLAAVPAAAAMLTLIFGVKESRRAASATGKAPSLARQGLSRRFWLYLAVLLVFTLGNSTDALLILRRERFGVTAALVPILCGPRREVGIEHARRRAVGLVTPAADYRRVAGVRGGLSRFALASATYA
jgi:dipeptide/tripeptide permease